MTKPTKLIVFSCGGKGGVGKTTVATAIADFYATRAIPATLFDCDTENKQRGSLSHFFPTATKLDIRAERGLDRFVDTMLTAGTPVALADLAAGSGRDMVRNDDWTTSELFEELGARGVSDRRFGKCLEMVVAPLVRDEPDQLRYAEKVNGHLARAGYALRPVEEQSGYPVYRLVALVGGVAGNPCDHSWDQLCGGNERSDRGGLPASSLERRSHQTGADSSRRVPPYGPRLQSC